MTPSNGNPLDWLYRLAIEFAAGDDEKYRAIGLNLIYDHRISAERAQHFRELFSHYIESKEKTLDEALSSYRKEWIARLPHETFHNDAGNRDNHVYDLGTKGLAPNFEIVHVCNVTQKLLHMTDPAIRRQVPGLQLGTRNYANARDVDQSLTNRLRNREKNGEFVRHFLRLLEVHRQSYPWHPVWVTSWKEFEHCVDPDRPETWLEAVGLPCPPEPTWLLVLRYKAESVEHLYRPTQLEAGNFAWHFPSPKAALPPLMGGHPINLSGRRESVPGTPPSPNQPFRGLASEYVHTEIAFEPQHWQSGGSLLNRTKQATSGHLMGHRRAHHRILCEEYGPDRVLAWMPDAVKLP